jgi:hypothetical protein
MALSDKSSLHYEVLFDEMLKTVPDERREDFAKHRETIRKMVDRDINFKAVRLVKQIYLRMYSNDVEALRLDLTKIIVLDSQLGEISSKDRRTLLRILCEACKIVFRDDDFSELMNDWVAQSKWRGMQEKGWS